MPTSMGDQFRGLPMADLIGAPLMAACDAQVRLASATAQFIQQVGFTPKTPPAPGEAVPFKPGDFDVRTVSFRFDRPSTSVPPSQPGLPAPTETVELDVPLLAIVKIPSLAIDTVDITFDMEVKNSESNKTSTEEAAKFAGDATMNWGLFSVNVHVEGSVASHQENTRSSDQSAKYHVQVRAQDKGMPEGLARVLDMMNSAIAPKTIKQSGAATTGTTGGPTQNPAPMGPRGALGAPVELDHEEDSATVLRPGRYEVVDA